METFKGDTPPQPDEPLEVFDDMTTSDRDTNPVEDTSPDPERIFRTTDELADAAKRFEAAEREFHIRRRHQRSPNRKNRQHLRRADSTN